MIEISDLNERLNNLNSAMLTQNYANISDLTDLKEKVSLLNETTQNIDLNIDQLSQTITTLDSELNLIKTQQDILQENYTILNVEFSQITTLDAQQEILQENYTILNAKFNNILNLQGIPGPTGKDGAQGPPGENAEIPIGTVIFHGTMNGTGDSGDSTWVPCDGRPLLKSSYVELYNMLGTTYGSGDGVYSFNIPDLRGRTAVGSGQSPDGLSNRNAGDKGGIETVILTISQMPSHFHIQGTEGLGNSYGGGIYFGGRTYPDGGIADYANQHTSTTVGDQPHENMMPFLSLYALIRIL